MVALSVSDGEGAEENRALGMVKMTIFLGLKKENRAIMGIFVFPCQKLAIILIFKKPG